MQFAWHSLHRQKSMFSYKSFVNFYGTNMATFVILRHLATTLVTYFNYPNNLTDDLLILNSLIINKSLVSRWWFKQVLNAQVPKSWSKYPTLNQEEIGFLFLQKFDLYYPGLCRTCYNLIDAIWILDQYSNGRFKW